MIMKDKTLMTLMVECPGFIREKLLTDGQIELIKDAKRLDEEGLTSRWVSNVYDISIQSASSKLKKLHKKGYLKRTNEGADSGGDEYVYRVAI